MLHTAYSNLYEVLEAFLLLNLKDESSARTNLFEEIEVIVPTQASKELLKNKIADEFGICAGMKITEFSYWEPVRLWNKSTQRSQSLVWHIYSIISSPEFISKHPRLKRSLNEKSEVEKLEFCRRTASNFLKYAAYRLDWVRDWMEDSGRLAQGVFRRDEYAALCAHPDYEWQKDLWFELNHVGKRHPTAWEGCTSLMSGYEKLYAADDGPKGSLHVFLPFTLSPIVLPALRKEARKREVYLYVLNPCAEYWYQSLPRKLFGKNSEWSSESVFKSGEPLEFLLRNARTTRANIDRIAAFVADSRELDEFENDPGEALEISVGEGEASYARRDFDPSIDRIQDLKLDSSYKYLAEFRRFAKKDVLHGLQNSILALDAAELADEVREDDDSFLVLRAPTMKREVESIADLVNSLLKREEDPMKPTDVLVVVPDIEAAAPVIDGVMKARDADDASAFPWCISERSIVHESSAAASIAALVEWMSSRADAAGFYDWLEMPAAQKLLGWSADELNSVKSWLYAAGYRSFISKAHCADQSDGGVPLEVAEDGCLETALQRLLLGLAAGDERAPFNGMLPAVGRMGSYDSIDSGKDVFFALAVLVDKIEKHRLALMKKKKAGAEHWSAWLNGLIDDVFAESMKDSAGRSDVYRVKGMIESSAAGISGLGAEDSEVSFELYWNAASTALASESRRVYARGAVTFANMTQFRGVPFKCIIVMGLNEASKFPGGTSRDEFDLMDLKKNGEAIGRRGDRTSREDNRNAFLDCSLAAREKFVVSYSTEGGAGPSPLVSELITYLSLPFRVNGRPQGDFESAVTVEVPATSVDPRNFMKTRAKNWLSSGVDLMNAARGGGSQQEPAFLDEAAPLPVSSRIRIDEKFMQQFISSESEWFRRVIGMARNDEAGEEAAGFRPDDGALASSMQLRRFKGILKDAAELGRFNALDESSSLLDDLKKLEALDPENGPIGVRGWFRNGCIDRVAAAMRTLQERFEFVEHLPGEFIPAPDGFKWIEGVAVPAVDVYRDRESGEKVLAALCESSAEEKRTALACLLRRFKGDDLGYAAISLKEKKDGGPSIRTMEKPDPEEYVEVFMQAVEASVEKGVLLLPGGYPDPLLVRGLDAAERQKKLEKLEKYLNSLFDDKLAGRTSAQEAAAALDEFMKNAEG